MDLSEDVLQGQTFQRLQLCDFWGESESRPCFQVFSCQILLLISAATPTSLPSKQQLPQTEITEIPGKEQDLSQL